MPAIEPGRVCIKLTGRDNGEVCAVINFVDKNFVEIISKGRKGKRKCNIRHLEPLNKKIELKSEEEIKEMLKNISV